MKNKMLTNRVVGDRVLIKPIIETQTTSGIIIPDAARKKPKKGEVILVGPGTKDVKMEVSVEDTVLFGEYAGIEIEVEDEKFLLLKQEDIFLIIKKQ